MLYLQLGWEVRRRLVRPYEVALTWHVDWLQLQGINEPCFAFLAAFKSGPYSLTPLTAALVARFIYYLLKEHGKHQGERRMGRVTLALFRRLAAYLDPLVVDHPLRAITVSARLPPEK